MTHASGLTRAIHRALDVLHHVEDAVLALLLGAMVVLAPLQIFLRVFFDEGLTWADPLIRVLVLWVGLFGAISASRGDRHITIDVLSRLLRGRARAVMGLVVHVFTTSVCGIVAWHAWRFVESEREYESVAFLDVPTWALELILPFAFAMMAIRYGLLAVDEAGAVLGLRKVALVEPDRGGDA
jgi:TRAP-type C4-dicarboxylate transport system permease small subunit